MSENVKFTSMLVKSVSFRMSTHFVSYFSVSWFYDVLFNFCYVRCNSGLSFTEINVHSPLTTVYGFFCTHTEAFTFEK
jgi:hypothetical protein